MEIVNVLPYKNLNICLDTENEKYLKSVNSHFEYYVKNFRFSPMYQSGRWNGKKSLYRKSTRSLPYGLLVDLIKFTAKKWKDIKLVIDPEVKKLYQGIDITPKWDLLYEPHYYQKEVILSALKLRSGIFKCPTASGKCSSGIEIELKASQEIYEKLKEYDTNTDNKTIKIKIDHLFHALNMKNEASYKNTYDIQIKTHTGNFVAIDEFVIRKIDSYKSKFSNGLELISSNEHLILTDSGCKKIKDITSSDNIICGNEKIKKISTTIFKEDDTLYDFCIPYPHLFQSTDGIVHHNSLIVSYIARELVNSQETDQVLIIVPTASLVKQFKDDMIDYKIESSFIGMVDKDHKEWNNHYVISTWQSLKNNLDKLNKFDTIIVDEVHGVRGDVLHDILKDSPATWRFGFTGTMPDDILEELQVKSYLGTVLKSYSSSVLAEEGYIATCNINRINIHYSNVIKGEYNEIKNAVFNTQFRLNIIKSIVKSVDGSILLLVDKIELEGAILEGYLKSLPELSDREIIFIHGSVKVNDRSYWQKRTDRKKNIIVIATFGVFQMGINIRSLKYAVLCSSFKSNIRILQSIGRALRKHKDKDDTGAFIYDLNDQVKHLENHGNERLKYYRREGFNVTDIDIIEGQEVIDFTQLCQ